jgi:hypothetical protein
MIRSTLFLMLLLASTPVQGENKPYPLTATVVRTHFPSKGGHPCD